MKREYIALLIILGIAVAYRSYNFRLSYFTDNDVFLHASVMRQALTNGNLMTYELGYGNPLILEPLGLYYVTLLPALLIGLDTALLITPLISGVLCVLAFYFLIKQLFNPRAALIASLILALSLAHAYRTSPNIYRGDGFWLTIFVITLYYYFKDTRKDSIITGVLLGLSATLWNGYPLGVLVIISGIIISSTIKFIKNEFSKKDLINNALITGIYYGLELLFLLTGIVKDVFFTSNRALHALLIFSPLLINVIYLLTHKVKKSRVLTVLVIIGITLLVLNTKTISDVINQGLFEGSTFYAIGVSELLPPSQDMLYAVLSLTLYLLWPGLALLALLILKKQKPEHLTFLVWSIISVYLMINYSRYNFIASITTSALTAFLLDYIAIRVYKSKKLIHAKVFAILILALFFTFYITDSLTNINLINTRMNNYWLEALTWMKANLTSGMTLTWWDHGSWVQYYTGFPTIVDSVSGQATDRITRISQFLMSNKTENFTDWNVKYLVLGNDIILYSGAVTGIAGINTLQVSLVGQATTATLGNKTMIVYPISNEAWFETYPEGTLYRDTKGNVGVINKTLYANKTGTYTVISNHNVTNGCLILNPTMNLYMNNEMCKTNYVQLMFSDGLPGYQLLYRNDYVVIYRIL